MQVTLRKTGRGSGEIRVPGSKSLSHRALLCASLARGTSVLKGLAENEDIAATREALRCFGARITVNGDETTVTGGLCIREGTVIDCGGSATTLRFLIPLAALSDIPVRFTGTQRLMERPVQAYQDLFGQRGLLFRREGRYLIVQGPLSPGMYTVPGNVSSQFASGLLTSLPFLEHDSVLAVPGKMSSEPYVRMTLHMLDKAGIVICEDNGAYRIPGNQFARPFVFTGEGDYSAAAAPACAGVLGGQAVTVHGLNHSSLQGDYVLLDILGKMGADIESIADGYRFHPSVLHAAEIDLDDCPDLGPVLFALASQAEGTSVFHHSGRLRFKESDRLACMQEELRKTGCIMETDQDTVRIRGPVAIPGGLVLDGHDDHRIVMALSILARRAEGTIGIRGAEAVAKSWPEFFTSLSEIGIEAEMTETGSSCIEKGNPGK